MPEEERTAELGSLFESITGRESVVERQQEGPGSRVVNAEQEEESPVAQAVDTVEHHGLADAIAEPDE